MAYYPIFLELKNRRCLVIGGGEIALWKTKSLLECGARVQVVAPRINAGLKMLIRRKKISWISETFRPEHLNGMELVIAATDHKKTNALAAREAKKRNVWINVADQPALCGFILPSVVRRGKLTIAVSTGGISPALSKWIRQDLQQRYGDDWEQLLKTMHPARARVQKAVSSVGRRKKLLENALSAYIAAINEGTK